MARQLRVQYPGAIYHVSVRSNGKEDLFDDDFDRRYLLSRLSEAVETYGVRLYLFCLMGNHFHLVVETPKANIDRFMHGVLTGYGVHYNRVHHRHGHVTQGRYGAKLVGGNDYLLKLSRYVHLNPVKIKKFEALPFQDRIKYLREYPWSSYRGYTGIGERNKFVEYGPMLSLMECAKKRRAAEYRRFVEAGVARNDEEFLAELERSPRSIGDDKFRKWVDECYEELLETGKTREDAAFRRLNGKQSPDVILCTVAQCGKVKKEELNIRSRDSRLRAVASLMLCKYGGLTQREAALMLGLTTGVAVSCQLKKLQRLQETDPSLRRLVTQLDKRFSAKERRR